ncbi:lysozyme [Acidisphaera sp. S103]|uniref:lysozyme n=1 Tax=Acidisphaera sp. S103 TaxID=1747223 RepID=UPI00131B0657|nr:lysozyme [Acidisphaera sp. S103]
MTDPALAIAIPFVAQFERFVPVPYHGAADRLGVWSIGYGFTFLSDGSAVTADTPQMTQAEADERLSELLAALLASIRRIVSVPITDHMAAALASFAYNVGFPALEHSTLLACLNAGNPIRAAAYFESWVYANGIMVAGLVRRRAAEKALALTADGAVASPDSPTPPNSTDSHTTEDSADELMDRFNPEVPA